MASRSEIEALLRELAPMPIVVSSPLHLPQGEVREYAFGLVEKSDGSCDLYIRKDGKWKQVNIGGGSVGSVEWGDITGTLTSQTDLATELQNISTSLSAHINNQTNPHGATATPTPNKIPIADGNGKLNNWIDPPTPSQFASKLPVWLLALNPIDSNHWIVPYAVGSNVTLTTIDFLANTIIYHPFVPPINCRVTNIGFNRLGSISGSIELGLYNTSSGRPNTKLFSGSVSAPLSGVYSVSCNVSLQAGQVYWIAYIATAGMTTRALPTTQFGGLITHNISSTELGVALTQSGESLPATAGGLSLVSSTAATPMIFLKIAPP